MSRRAQKTDVGVVIKKEPLPDVIAVDETDSGQKPLLTCNLCQQSFRSSKRMRNHQSKCFIENGSQDLVAAKKIITLTKDKSPRYSCKVCNKKFKFEQSFKDHIKNVHSTSPNSIACKECTARCPDMGAMANHLEKDHRKPIFKCPNCDATFSRNYHVSRHLDQKGCGLVKSKSFSCKICGSRFTRKDNLMFHLRNNHIPDLKKYQCKQCVFGVDNFSTLVRHYTNRHLGKIFICDICGNAVGSRIAIGKHLETHGEKRFKCDICDYKTYTIEVLRRHENIHLKKKPHPCPVCSASFTQPQQLRLHLKTHWTLFCRRCNIQFIVKDEFQVHLNMHLIKKERVLCPLTGCTSKTPFTDVLSFQNHLDEHSYKLYPCQLCGKNFDSYMKLKRHSGLHALEKPRRCMYCVNARAYGRGDRLIMHLRKEHPETFKSHWTEVRKSKNQNGAASPDVIGRNLTRRDMRAILDLLDNMQDEGMVTAEVQHVEIEVEPPKPRLSLPAIVKTENPIMSEEELLSSLKVLLEQLIDAPMLAQLDFPQVDVDVVLENILKHCELQVADRSRWSRVQCLRENLKQMFLRVIDDPGIKKMLELHTIDQVVRNIINIKS